MATDDDDGMGTGLFEPVAPPRYPISSTNQGGYAFIAALLPVLIAGLAVLVKLHMTASTFRKLRRDDVALLGALVCCSWDVRLLLLHELTCIRSSRSRIQRRCARVSRTVLAALLKT